MLKYIRLIALLVVLTGFIGVPRLHAEWIEDGIPLATASGAQDSPAITADGTGGAVIVWRDSRTAVNTGIYAQGVTADGAIRWYPTGMPVCTAANSQSYPLIIPDGSDGTIIVWLDTRTGGSVDIYAQKLNSIGYIQWPTNGVAICTGQTGLDMGGIVSDGAGGAIITWQDRRNFYSDIFAQRIASNGTVMWTANGVSVCTADMHQQHPVLAADGTGGVIIVWEDRRSGDYNIYAQRLNSSGTPQWTSDGVVICDSGQNQINPRIVDDGSGGAIIAWSDFRNTMDYDIFAQRINSNGELQWGFGTAVSAWMYNQAECQLVHIGSGEAVVTWLDGRSGTSTDIYAQKLSAAGACQWTSNGVAVCGATGDQGNVRIAYNGSGGAFISWDDERAGTADVDIYAQNVGTDGTPAWTADGEVMCGASGNQSDAVISEDGSSGIFLAWTDGRSGTNKVYSHRVDAAGNIPAATLLQHYTAETSGTSIRITWTLSEIDEGVRFFIFRADGPSMEFYEVPAVDLTENGLLFSFVDRNCEPGLTYYYRVSYSDGEKIRILFESGPVTMPAMALMLHQNMPNPFNPSTAIGYYLPEAGRVVLEVFDVNSRRIVCLVDKEQSSGHHSARWNGLDMNGNQVSSGIYFYRITAGKETISRKMVLIK